MNTRRQFLRYLAASPAFPYLDLPSSWFGDAAQDEELIAAAKDAVNVFDFEPVARRKLPPAHFGYLATGVDDDATVRANREGFSKFQLRVRRLIDVRNIDMGVRIFGTAWTSPIVLAPVGHQKAFHPDGEI